MAARNLGEIWLVTTGLRIHFDATAHFRESGPDETAMVNRPEVTS
jgi:hypothetical protein